MTLIRATQSLLNQDLCSLSELIERDFPHLELLGFEKEIYI